MERVSTTSVGARVVTTALQFLHEAPPSEPVENAVAPQVAEWIGRRLMEVAS